MIDCEKFWKMYHIDTLTCTKHNTVFLKNKYCPGGRVVVEKDKISKDSREVSTPTYSSNPLTAKQWEALKLHQEGASFSRIGKLLNISKGSAQQLVNRAIKNALSNSLTLKRVPLTIAKKRPLTIRLHNDTFKVSVLCKYSDIIGNIKSEGRNLEYKVIINSPTHYVKIHKNNIMTIQFREDIICETVAEALELADHRADEYIRNWNITGITIISNHEVISRHYGILGVQFSKKLTDQRRLLIVRDGRGQVRLRIDFSLGKGQVEIDAENVKEGPADANNTITYMDDIIEKPHYNPSEVKTKIDNQEDKLRHVEEQYINSKSDNTKQLEFMAENNKSHHRVLKNIEKAILKSNEANMQLKEEVQLLNLIIKELTNILKKKKPKRRKKKSPSLR